MMWEITYTATVTVRVEADDEVEAIHKGVEGIDDMDILSWDASEVFCLDDY